MQEKYISLDTSSVSKGKFETFERYNFYFLRKKKNLLEIYNLFQIFL